eukprot:TRINITY_DN49171_c0_g1_i3.p2 TRINITY_DN49171_c0_g1~~TRINITY_DN49171_c0_g1_i3.p2  ORF type:complete len:107 (+),score=12.02 TRINITY_DN49171_c0_g1_i3:79-399(+)
MVIPSDEDLEYLDKHCRLTRQEIEKYYANAEHHSLEREDFDRLLDDAGIFKGADADVLRGRFYVALDKDRNGSVSMREFVIMLSTLGVVRLKVAREGCWTYHKCEC